jgi:3-hexulose-6-phosphate synthase
MNTSPLLQIALDDVPHDGIFDLLAQIYAHVDIIDIGILLLKREGIKIITQIKAAYPEKLVFVDTKTIDFGRLEAELVFEAGADIMSVCCAAANITIELAIRQARVMGKKVAIDLLGTDDWHRQLKRLNAFKPDYIVVHTGVDEWHSGQDADTDLFTKVEIISPYSPTPLAIAGGIQLDDIPYLLLFHPAILIVGSAITKASDPAEAARQFAHDLHDPRARRRMDAEYLAE